VLDRLRDDARAIARAAVEAAKPETLLAPFLVRWRAEAQAAGATRATVIAAGKAAGPMLRACLDADLIVARGLVTTTHLDGELPPQIEVHLAGHPVPTEASEAAARRALALAAAAGVDDTLLVLLSGGASALMSAPVAGLSLEDKMAATRLLLRGGAAIHELNCVRKHLSAIKGGQLAAAAGCASLTWALSDVVGPVEDDPSVIGSGPTVVDPTTYADALAIIDRLELRAGMPAGVMTVLAAGAAGFRPETPKPGDRRLARARYAVVGGRRHAMAGAVRDAEARGYRVLTIDEPIVGEAREAGPALAARAYALAAGGPGPVCVIASGETTVRVVGHGRGGRNQELALAAARALSGFDRECVLVSAGTDGVDGPTDAAGALADRTTAARARREGVGEIDRYLDDNDAWRFFDRLGDLLRAGPTHTNVGDVQVVVFA
jgi:glycerate 2-kinase